MAPTGRSTRPTSDRVREAVFSMLGSLGLVEGVRVADLFAGSGALGIEALSRGAAHATFVESDRGALAVLKANLAAAGISGERCAVVRSEVLTWTAREAGLFDVVLADPPYAWRSWDHLMAALRSRASLVVMETGDVVEVPPEWELLKARRYGSTVVTLARPAAHRPELAPEGET